TASGSLVEICLTGNIISLSLCRPKTLSLGFIISMEKQNPQPVCGKEALLLLNCVTESPYDSEKCIRFLQSLRECVLSKVSSLLPLVTDLYQSFVSGKVNKFVIPSQEHASEGAGGSATKPPS
ncbi:hypothetical protein HID58_078088, partial [Brassica napus]